jgi:hypothetical protein
MESGTAHEHAHYHTRHAVCEACGAEFTYRDYGTSLVPETFCSRPCEEETLARERAEDDAEWAARWQAEVLATARGGQRG